MREVDFLVISIRVDASKQHYGKLCSYMSSLRTSHVKYRKSQSHGQRHGGYYFLPIHTEPFRTEPLRTEPSSISVDRGWSSRSASSVMNVQNPG
jgi:hypothetical protein